MYIDIVKTFKHKKATDNKTMDEKESPKNNKYNLRAKTKDNSAMVNENSGRKCNKKKKGEKTKHQRKYSIASDNSDSEWRPEDYSSETISDEINSSDLEISDNEIKDITAENFQTLIQNSLPTLYLC